MKKHSLIGCCLLLLCLFTQQALFETQNSISASSNHCLASNPQGQCTQCQPRYYISNGQCIRVDDSCNTWDTQTGTCITCYEGFGDQNGNAVNGKCEFITTTTSQPQTQTTSNSTEQPSSFSYCDPNCKSYNQQRQCIECYQGYYIGSTSPSLCQPYPANCIKVNQFGHCITCITGYSVSSTGQCIIGTNNSTVQVANCMKYYCSNKCIKCQLGFYLNCDHQCTALSAYCMMGDMDGQCTLCESDYFLFNGLCYANNNTINNQTSLCNLTLCKTINSMKQVCATCYQHSYVNSQGCCQQVNGFCSEWTADGTCTACYKGYQLNPFNQKECVLITGDSNNNLPNQAGITTDGGFDNNTMDGNSTSYNETDYNMTAGGG